MLVRESAPNMTPPLYLTAMIVVCTKGNGEREREKRTKFRKNKKKVNVEGEEEEEVKLTPME